MSDQFTFKVTNSTDLTITELWASIDEEDWAQFTLDDAGIPPGQTATLVWDEHANDSPCEWYISAVFEDGSESEPAVFDFCEEPDIEISHE